MLVEGCHGIMICARRSLMVNPGRSYPSWPMCGRSRWSWCQTCCGMFRWPVFFSSSRSKHKATQPHVRFFLWPVLSTSIWATRALWLFQLSVVPFTSLNPGVPCAVPACHGAGWTVVSSPCRMGLTMATYHLPGFVEGDCLLSE